MATILRLPQLACAEHIWRNFDTFLFDADGVLWREQVPLEGAIQLLDGLIGAGKRVMAVTNNSTRDAEQHAQKCAKMGFKG
jgi:ribonucleotide monophosphatase NagD (HAD superfamily)